MYRTFTLATACAAALMLGACETSQADTSAAEGGSTTSTATATPTTTGATGQAAQQHGGSHSSLAWTPAAGAQDAAGGESKPGFTVEEADGVLWVLEPGQQRTADAVTLVAAGPGGKSIRATDRETALEYIAAKPGFNTMVQDGRIWVLEAGEKPEPDHVTLVGKGPRGMTIKANNRETALRYLYSKPGFNVDVEDGRLWVLKPGQEKAGDHVTLVNAYEGMTVKAMDRETALQYITSKPGFETRIVDGRLWVLRPGEEPAADHVTRVNAGPMGMTVKGNDRETIDAYMRS